MIPYLAPEMADVVVDLSHHQKEVDFARASEAGIAAAILKASEGEDWIDPAFHERAAAVSVAGLLPGAYHFLRDSDPIAQADHFLSVVANAVPSLDALLLALDFEPDPSGRSATAETAAAAALRIRERLGRWPVLYAGRYSVARPHEVLACCPLWLPEYGAAPICPPGWREWRLWQHTDGQRGLAPHPVPGLGRCDRSRFAGSLAELQTWWGT